MTRTFFIALSLLAAALVAACGPGGLPSNDTGIPLQAWIDAPLDGSAIPVENYTIIFSGANLDGAIDSFEVFVNGDPQDTVPVDYENNQGEAQYGFGQYDWLPAAPGNYLIEVRALSGENASPLAQASVIVGELVQDDGQGPVQVEEPAEAEDSLVAIPDLDVNCRLGNSSQWDIADTLFGAEAYQPLGRGNDNLWVQFAGPVTNTPCWVFIDNLTLLVNDEETPIEEILETLLPYLPYPATPTPTATATATPQPTATFTPAPPECDDGIDNDGDGRIDYRAPGIAGAGVGDRECDSPDDDNESR